MKDESFVYASYKWTNSLNIHNSVKLKIEAKAKLSNSREKSTEALMKLKIRRKLHLSLPRLLCSWSASFAMSAESFLPVAEDYDNDVTSLRNFSTRQADART